MDTTSPSGVGINTNTGDWALNVKGADANVFKVQASDGNTLSFLQGTNGDATQKWFADGNVTKVLINTNGDSYFTGGNVGIGTSTPSSFDSEANNLVVGTGSGDNGITIYTGSSAGHHGSIFSEMELVHLNKVK